MSNYNTLKQDAKVAGIEFVGGGIAVVTLNKGYGNPNKAGFHSEQQTFHAYCFDAAQKFVDGAVESHYAGTPGGKPCRVTSDTPWACNPHSEAYWSN